MCLQAKEHGARDDPKTKGLYRDEITDIFESEGLEFSNSEIQTFFAYFDVCDDSTIVSWFILNLLIEKVFSSLHIYMYLQCVCQTSSLSDDEHLFIVQIANDSELRIRDAKYIPRFSQNKKSRYVPPMTGRVRMKIVDSFQADDKCFGLTSYQVSDIVYGLKNNC